VTKAQICEMGHDDAIIQDFVCMCVYKSNNWIMSGYIYIIFGVNVMP
jgi:hypothetical protein